jgi:hypothetical protein
MKPADAVDTCVDACVGRSVLHAAIGSSAAVAQHDATILLESLKR